MWYLLLGVLAFCGVPVELTLGLWLRGLEDTCTCSLGESPFSFSSREPVTLAMDRPCPMPRLGAVDLGTGMLGTEVPGMVKAVGVVMLVALGMVKAVGVGMLVGVGNTGLALGRDEVGEL
mmetsp:Transcript_14748/g.34962  ORF Transcript_14748/g.34962 Transcript_14748/m.34962 type:complete len:120 (-) Transcript_14748:344-703(-)